MESSEMQISGQEAPPAAREAVVPSAAFEESIGTWLAPVAQSDASGNDPRYSPRFDAIQTELNKLEDPNAGRVDWRQISSLCEDTLQKEAKELTIASYLAFSWTQTKSLEGIWQGATLLSTLMERHWDSMFPKVTRLRARLNAAAWYVERLEEWLLRDAVSRNLKASDRDDVLASIKACERLEKVLEERFADKAPSLMKVQNTLTRFEKSIPQEAPKPAVQQAPTAEEQAKADGSVSASGASSATENSSTQQEAKAIAPAQVPPPPANLSGIENFLRQTSRTLLTTIETLRKDSPNCVSDPKYFKLWMNSLYLAMHQLPQRNQNDVTRTIVAPPAAQVMTGMASLSASPNAIEQVCWTLERNRFAFDLHLLLSELLEKLGPSFQAARDGHREEFSALMARLPGILELSFDNGVPFASENTRAWAQTLSSQGATGDAGSQTVSNEKLKEVIRQATDLAKKGQPKKALQIMIEARRHLDVGQERFQLTLAMAELCQEINLVHIAAPLFTELAEKIKTHHLEDWQPELASKALLGWYRCLSASTNPLSSEEELAYMKLCQLDPVLALQVRPLDKKNHKAPSVTKPKNNGEEI